MPGQKDSLGIKRLRQGQAKRMILLLVGFIFFLLVIPQINTLLTPCLQLSPGQSFNYQDCHITLVLDRFLALSLAGMAMTLVSFVVFVGLHPPKTALFGLFLAVLVIVAYYLYIPTTEAALKNVPVILSPESFNRPLNAVSK